jgi:hypothetical protein
LLWERPKDRQISALDVHPRCQDSEWCPDYIMNGIDRVIGAEGAPRQASR